MLFVSPQTLNLILRPLHLFHHHHLHSPLAASVAAASAGAHSWTRTQSPSGGRGSSSATKPEAKISGRASGGDGGLTIHQMASSRRNSILLMMMKTMSTRAKSCGIKYGFVRNVSLFNSRFCSRPPYSIRHLFAYSWGSSGKLQDLRVTCPQENQPLTILQIPIFCIILIAPGWFWFYSYSLKINTPPRAERRSLHCLSRTSLDSLMDPSSKRKAFQSYGYLLPTIIASMLLATGPKAFLMALALPVGQSAISLAFEKLWGHEELRARSRTMRKPYSRFSTDFRKHGQDESSDEYKRRAIYQSWVAADAGLNDDKARDSERPSFGGWDDLDQPKRQARWRPPKVDRSTLSAEVKIGKLSKKGRYRDAPLILRLLIAVFPFLGSWTRIL